MTPAKHEIETQKSKPKQAPVKTKVNLRDFVPAAEPDAPGTLPSHHIPIYDHNGHLRGRVGPKATSVTVARFLGWQGASLGKKDGRDAWIGQKPPKPPMPPKPVVAPKPTPAELQNHKLEISLKADKGSVTKTPSAPKTTARPKR